MAGRLIYVWDDGDEVEGFRDLQVPVWSEDRQRWEARHIPISVDGQTGAVVIGGGLPEGWSAHQVILEAEEGQTAPLLVGKDEDGDSRFRVVPGGNEVSVETWSKDEAIALKVLAGNDAVTVQTWGANMGFAGFAVDTGRAQIFAEAEVGQTDPLLRLLDEEGADLFGVDPVTGETTTPAGTLVASEDVTNIVQLTQVEYDALDPVVATTLYVIVG